MAEATRRTLAMTGATGFVGSALHRLFKENGWHVLPLGRADFQGDAAALAARISGAEAVVNLAGAPVIGRWTEEYKKILRNSRIDLTRLLVDALALLDTPPKVLLSTSAVGIYAPSETRQHTEDDHELADDFLGQLALDWEAEANRAAGLGIRTAIFRFGIVLGPDGGALQKMLLPFRLGLGGTIGDGRQPVSWIHLKDLGRVYLQAVDDPAFSGIYNLTAPQATTNRGLTRALGRALGRPTLLRIPQFVLRLQFGQGAHILTSGQTVLPKRLLDQGFSFAFADIDSAVRDCIA